MGKAAITEDGFLVKSAFLLVTPSTEECRGLNLYFKVPAMHLSYDMHTLLARMSFVGK